MPSFLRCLGKRATLVRSARSASGAEPVTRPDVAYYYPAPFWDWSESGWVKSLLLFFDRVAILLPDYMYGRHIAADPTMVLPLEERGLLQILEPGDWVDEKVTTELATVLVELLTAGAFDDLPEATYFAELSQSRVGYSADVGLAEMLVEELVARGLASPSEDGVSIPLHPVVRTTILVTLAQLARAAGARRGMSVHPATSHAQAVTDLIHTLSREPLPSVGRVVELDLEPVSLNLDPVPLDDVLAFRTEHQAAHKAYMRNLQGFLVEVAGVTDDGERASLLLERRQEISDAAHELQRRTRQAIGKNLASWSMGISGAAWALASQDPLGIALAAAGLVPQMIGSREQVTAYSYLFTAQRQLRGPSGT